MPAASTPDGTTTEGASTATAGKAEKEAAFDKAQATQNTHGRGHHKAD